ncbi:MAG: hypothetical protein N3A72_00235 [bacterium]|nr:hypothetical protein [bacterium]
MNYKKYSLIILLGYTLFYFGCANKSTSATASDANKHLSRSTPSGTSVIPAEVKTEPDLMAEIIESDIFTPPDMRRSIQPAIPIIERVIEPEKLTITGIVYDGTQYLVLVENLNSGDANYLKVNDQLLDYSITTIDFDKVVLEKKNQTKTYYIGDQIPIPGTGTIRTEVPEKGDTSDIENQTITPTTETVSSGAVTMPLPPGDSLEERLRKRRLQQEEELK